MLKEHLEKFPYYKLIVPKALRKEWESHLIKSIVFELLGYFIVPIVSIFVRLEVRTDRVKRIDDKQHTMLREYLPKIFDWWQTHDNAQDEYFWGKFAEEGEYLDTTIEEYNNSRWLRYCNRVMWGWRNMGYGYLYHRLGVTQESEPIRVFEEGIEDSGKLWVRIETYQNYFLYEAQIPNDKGYKSYKFGWKSHRSAPELEDGTKNVMYANRIITNTRTRKK